MKSPPPRETAIVKRIQKFLAGLGCVVRKRHGTVMQVAGDPDLYGSTPEGRHFEIEVKRLGENPTKIQLYRLAEWAKANALTGVARSIEDARGILGLVPANPPGEEIQWVEGYLQRSPCHMAPVVMTRLDGVFIGTCSSCNKLALRINPKTGRTEVPQ